MHSSLLKKTAVPFAVLLLAAGCGYGNPEQLGESGEVDSLLVMLRSGDREYRRSALSGLGIAAQHTHPSEYANPGHDPSILVPAVEPVISALLDEDQQVRPNAAFALRWIAVKLDDPVAREKAVEALVDTLEKAHNLYSREQAAEALTILLEAQPGDAELSERAQAALQQYQEATSSDRS